MKKEEEARFLKEFFKKEEVKDYVESGDWGMVLKLASEDEFNRAWLPRLVRQFLLDEAKIVFNVKGWFRVTVLFNYQSYALVCTKIKKGIKVKLKNDAFIEGKDCPLFFPSLKEAIDFLEKNKNIGDWIKIDLKDTDIYQPRLRNIDKEKGFVKIDGAINTPDSFYIQGWKEDLLK